MDEHILAKLEDALRRLEAEAGEHQAISEGVQKNAASIEQLGVAVERIRVEQVRLREAQAPIVSFFHDMETVSRIGRLVRAIVGWLALMVGSVAMVYVAVDNN